MSDLAERSNINIDIWNLFIAIVSFSLTYQVIIMTLASTVYKKSTFQKKKKKKKQSHLIAFGRKFELDVNGLGKL